MQSAGLVEELGSLGQQDPAQEPAHEGRALIPDTLKIGGIQRSAVRYGAVVFGMFAKGAESGSQRLRKAPTERGSHANDLIALCKQSSLPKLDGFVERNAEHGIGGFKLLQVGFKNCIFFLGQSCAPVRFDGRATGMGGVDAVFHGRSPWEQNRSITKSNGGGKIFFVVLRRRTGKMS